MGIGGRVPKTTRPPTLPIIKLRRNAEISTLLPTHKLDGFWEEEEASEIDGGCH